MPTCMVVDKPGCPGFTLIELMIVLAIISVLAAVAVPQFGQLINKSKEGSTKGNLGIIRSALSIYFGDNESAFPTDDLSTSLLAAVKYLPSMPAAQLPRTSNNAGHGLSTGVTVGVFPGAIADSVGGWAYDNGGTGDPEWGTVLVNCSHKDLNGDGWTTF